MSTKNIVPRTTHEGQIGRVDKVWSAAHIDDVYANNIEADGEISSSTISATGSATVGSLTSSGGATVGSLTTSGSISAGSVSASSLSTSGSITGATLSLTSNTANTLFWLNRKATTSYQVGDIAYTPTLPSWARLECVKAGSTSVEEPTWGSIKQGSVISDGTLQWIIDDLRDNTPVGDVVFRPFTKTGYVACTGQTLNRTDYPRLVKFIEANSLWTTNQDNEPWKFGNGDGSTTFVTPNYTNRFVEGGASAAKLEAGLPNITGSTRTYTTYPFGSDLAMQGAFYLSNAGSTNIANTGATISGGMDCAAAFNANRSSPIYGNSNTVQPPAIQLIPQIKY